MNDEIKNIMVPKLRFPEFENEGEWEEKRLKQLGKFYRGLTYGADDLDSKGLLVLRSGNIQNESLVFDNDLVFVKKDCPKDLKLLRGDIVICMSNGSKALVGKNAEFKGEYNELLTVGAFCSIMRPKNKFTKYILQTDKYQSFISLSIGGGNINNLKNSDLEEYECFVPKNPTEQQKIAS
jgi:type I restriction enzyme S subunit